MRPSCRDAASMACQLPARRAPVGASPMADWSSRMARRASPGTACLSSSMRFGLRSPVMMATPVRFPPGLERLATNPCAIGSPETNTIGVVVVARWAAFVAGLPSVTRMSTLSRTSSAASSGYRSAIPCAYRCSIARLPPSTQPRSFSACRNGLRASGRDSGASHPILAVEACCATAARGVARAPSPSTARNALRPIVGSPVMTNTMRFPSA